MLREKIGDWLLRQQKAAAKWKLAMFGILGALLAANVVLHPHHPHFALEKYWGFWALFGLGVAVVMVFVLKKIVFPIISVSEDIYDRDK